MKKYIIAIIAIIIIQNVQPLPAGCAAAVSVASATTSCAASTTSPLIKRKFIIL
jgi:hypothetical protein